MSAHRDTILYHYMPFDTHDVLITDFCPLDTETKIEGSCNQRCSAERHR